MIDKTSQPDRWQETITTIAGKLETSTDEAEILARLDELLLAETSVKATVCSSDVQETRSMSRLIINSWESQQKPNILNQFVLFSFSTVTLSTFDRVETAVVTIGRRTNTGRLYLTADRLPYCAKFKLDRDNAHWQIPLLHDLVDLLNDSERLMHDRIKIAVLVPLKVASKKAWAKVEEIVEAGGGSDSDHD